MKRFLSGVSHSKGHSDLDREEVAALNWRVDFVNVVYSAAEINLEQAELPGLPSDLEQRLETLGGLVSALDQAFRSHLVDNRTEMSPSNMKIQR